MPFIDRHELENLQDARDTYKRIAGERADEVLSLRRQLDAANSRLYTAQILASASQGAHQATRRETLRTVIKALKLTQYGYRESGAYHLGGFIGLPDTDPADRFWEDINTALDVREERKRQETREKTEQRIAALAKEGKGGSK